jgi:hypothetical protein
MRLEPTVSNPEGDERENRVYFHPDQYQPEAGPVFFLWSQPLCLGCFCLPWFLSRDFPLFGAAVYS